jgi:hypothetical protein
MAPFNSLSDILLLYIGGKNASCHRRQKRGEGLPTRRKMILRKYDPNKTVVLRETNFASRLGLARSALFSVERVELLCSAVSELIHGWGLKRRPVSERRKEALILTCSFSGANGPGNSLLTD